MTAPVPSPCVNVCRMDDATGLCAGCLRTLDGIAAWSRLPEPARRAVWAELGRRRVLWLQQGRGPLPPLPEAAA
jgi:uncharacterized protein